MMRYFLVLVGILITSLVYGQADTSGFMPQKAKGYKFNRITIDSLANIPTDTTVNKLGIARIGSVLYAGNGVRWTAMEQGGNIDTIAAQVYALQQALEDTADAIRSDIPDQANQLIFGGDITGVSHLQFYITDAQYRISGRTYNSPDTLITLAAAGDSDRIDVFVVDTLGRVRSYTGVQSSNPVPPSIDPLKELLLNFVFVGTDTVYQPTVTPQYWTQVGTDIVNINTGAVRFSNGSQMDSYLGYSRFNAGSPIFLQGTGTNKVNAGTFGGNSGSGTSEFRVALGDPSLTSGTKTGHFVDGRILLNSGTATVDFVKVQPTFSQSPSSTYSGVLTGYKYDPVITSPFIGTEYAFWSRRGGVRYEGLAYSADTTYLGLCIDASGNVYRCPRSTGSGGGSGISRQELIDTANAIRTSLAAFQAAMYDSLGDLRAAIGTGGVTQGALDDSTQDIRQYVAENIKYIAADSGVVIRLDGDTVKVGVDTTYIQAHSLPYKVYTALVSQSGTNAPTAIVLQNTLGEITYTYSTSGQYQITSSSLFTSNKTFITYNTHNSDDGGTSIYDVFITRSDAYLLSFNTLNGGVNQDGLIPSYAPIYLEIRVYN